MYLGIEQFKEKFYLINVRADISLIYKVKFPPVFKKDEEGILSIQQSFSNALKYLGMDICLQRMDFISTKKNQYQKHDDILIERGEERFFQTMSFRSTESYFIFTLKANPNKKPTYYDAIVERSSKKKTLFENKHYTDEAIQKFNISILNFFDNFLRGFQGKEIAFKLCNDIDIKNLVQNKYFNLNIGTNVEKSVINTIVDKDKFISSGNKAAYIFNLAGNGLPKELSLYVDGQYKSKYGALDIWMLHDLYFNTGNDLIINSVYEGFDNKKYIDSLKQKQKLAASLKFGSTSNELLSESVDQLMLILNQNPDEKLVKFHFSVIAVMDESMHEEARQIRLNSLRNTMLGYDFEVEDNQNQPLRKFGSCSPGNATDLAEGEKNIVLTNIAAAISCFEHSTVGTATKGIPLMDIKTKELIQFNNNAYETKHFTVFGPTGTGKSFTCNHIIKNLITQGCDVVVGDVGYSYLKLCKYFGGEYYEMSSENPLKMNPFFIFRKNQDGLYVVEKSDDDDSLEFVVNLFGICFKGSDGTEIDNAERSYLITILTDYIGLVNKEKRIPSFTDFYHSIDTLIKDDQILQVPSTIFDIQRFKLIMNNFVKGNEYGHIFDTDVELKLADKKFVVFEFEKIRNNKILFPISYFILTSMVLKKIYTKKSLKPFYLVFDEVNVLLSGEYGKTAKFVDYCVRTMRKWDAGLGLSTQNIEDLNKSMELKGSIINNTAMFYFKRQPEAQKQFIQQNLEMSDFNIKKLFSIQDKFKEIFIYDKQNIGHLFRIETNMYNYWLYTTDPDDKKIFNKYFDKYKDLNTTLVSLVENNAIEEVKLLK
jgi:hypothetical protein